MVYFGLVSVHLTSIYLSPAFSWRIAFGNVCIIYFLWSWLCPLYVLHTSPCSLQKMCYFCCGRLNNVHLPVLFVVLVYWTHFHFSLYIGFVDQFNIDLLFYKWSFCIVVVSLFIYLYKVLTRLLFTLLWPVFFLLPMCVLHTSVSISSLCHWHCKITIFNLVLVFMTFVHFVH